MSYPIRCEFCHGSKKVVGLGMLVHQCPNCNGIGYVAKPQAEPEKSIDPTPKKRAKRNEAGKQNDGKSNGEEKEVTHLETVSKQ